MQTMKKVTTGLIVLLTAWLLTSTANAEPARAPGKAFKTRPGATAMRTPPKPSVVMKAGWVGGAPWIGGHATTVMVKAPESRKLQSQSPSPLRRVWVGGAPWLGGYEISVPAK